MLIVMSFFDVVMGSQPKMDALYPHSFTRDAQGTCTCIVGSSFLQNHSLGRAIGVIGDVHTRAGLHS